jgi:hypothetical protein
MSDFSFSDDDDSVVVDLEEALGDDILRCDVCGKDDFKNAHGLAIHQSRMHGIKSTTSDTAPKGRSVKNTDLEKELAEFFGTAGLLVSMFDQVDGMVIAQNSERLASAWAHLARTNKTVDRVIRNVLTTSAVGEVVTATIMTAVPIMAHHGVLPEQMFAMFAQAPMPPSEEGMEGNAND